MLINRYKGRAFTLIELLVVISIIAILMAIMAPALNKARESAKKSICISHCKQWAVATTQYTMDNNSKFPDRRVQTNVGWQFYYNNPMIYYAAEANFVRTNMVELFVKPYLVDYKITRCPGGLIDIKDWDTQLEENKTGATTFIKGNYHIFVGYPKTLPTGVEWDDPEKFVTPSRISEASPYMAVAGCMVENKTTGGQWEYSHPKSFKVSEEPNGSPIAFVDGHSEFVDFQDYVVFHKYTRSPNAQIWWPNPKR